MIVPPNILTPVVDKEGKLTPEFHTFLNELVTHLNEHEDRIEDLEP